MRAAPLRRLAGHLVVAPDVPAVQILGRRVPVAPLVVLAILIAALGGAAALRLRAVHHQLSDAEQRLQRVEALVRRGDLGAADAQLREAERLVATANGTLHTSASLAPMRLVPIARQNLLALERSVQVTLTLTNGARSVLRAAAPLAASDGRLQVGLRGGVVPLATIRAVREALDEVSFSLPDRDRPKTTWVFGPIRTLENSVFDEAARRRRQFVSLSRGLNLLGEMAGDNGARRYLIAVANAAEMRGSGGMILSYGTLTSADGKIALERFGSVDEIPLAQPVAAPGPADYLKRFASLSPTQLWRSANLGSDLTFVGPILEQMYTKATGDPVDGVIQVDSVGLAAILEGVGPIETPELGSVDAQNAVALTLNDAYVKFPDRPVRQEYLESVARVAFQRLLAGDYPSLTKLAGALARAGAGRHVLMHTTRPAPARVLAQMGVDGSLPGAASDFMQLTVQNLSGNKLDYYLETRLTITGTRQPSRQSTVRARIEVFNTAPPNGASRYVFGPFIPELRPGEYRGLASLVLPAGVNLAQPATGDVAGQPSVTTEGGRTVVSFTVDVAAGGRQSVTLDLRLPPEPPASYRWYLVPTPRVRPTQVDMDVKFGEGALRYRGPLDRLVALP